MTYTVSRPGSDFGACTKPDLTQRTAQPQNTPSTASGGIFLRAEDAVHLTTAQDLGEADLWTNDRHLLAAASHFGLIGRSV